MIVCLGVYVLLNIGNQTHKILMYDRIFRFQSSEYFIESFMKFPHLHE